MSRLCLLATGLLAFVLGSGTAPGANAADLPPELLKTTDIDLSTRLEPDRGGEWAVTVYGGFASDNKFSRIALTPWDAEIDTDIPWLAGSVSKRIWSWRQSVTVEAEGGLGYRFGSEDTGEIWGAIYVRYDDFPWNHIVYTTVAASTGLNYATKISPIERNKTGGSSRLLHYFSPEFTFARPEDKNLELVLRLHHRSGAFGLFNGASSGTNIVTLGVRKRF